MALLNRLEIACIIDPVDQESALAKADAILSLITRAPPDDVYRFDGWTLHTKYRTVLDARRRKVSLSNSEFNVLAEFVAYPETILTRKQLIMTYHRYDLEINDHSLNVLILRLRRKLRAHGLPADTIKTLRVEGYLFDREVVRVSREERGQSFYPQCHPAPTMAANYQTFDPPEHQTRTAGTTARLSQ